MSLRGAIEAFQKKVPPVLPPGNHGEPLEAPEIKEVPPVPWVPPEKTKSEIEIGKSIDEDDVLAHPERYEIVTFDRWRLPSGRHVSFKLAIPKERYDGFELIRLLEQFRESLKR